MSSRACALRVGPLFIAETSVCKDDSHTKILQLVRANSQGEGKTGRGVCGV